jgi:2-succinyl-5-enolpyruvyl-6-hydroxy-3-cyclohexene-1-carboxylate synthase
MKVSDFVVERFHAWGVRRIYGYPGDGINGVIGALQRANKIEFIQVRHEEMAAFMAFAHAKFTGEVGVCLSTGGPGATHMITGLYDAKVDHVPILAICGQAEATVRGASYQQELKLDRMFADVAGFAQEGLGAGSSAPSARSEYLSGESHQLCNLDPATSAGLPAKRRGTVAEEVSSTLGGLTGEIQAICSAAVSDAR